MSRNLYLISQLNSLERLTAYKTRLNQFIIYSATFQRCYADIAFFSSVMSSVVFARFSVFTENCFKNARIKFDKHFENCNVATSLPVSFSSAIASHFLVCESDFITLTPLLLGFVFCHFFALSLADFKG